eukprot:Skav200058  [mRNA]  locus=scaffold838:196:1710:- [translate_table: standard]
MDLYKRAESVGKAYYLRNCHAGCSIPNDLDPDASRGPMKINYAVSTQVRWSKQNDANAAAGRKRLSQGLYYRNFAKPPTTPLMMYEMLTSIGGPPIMPFRLAAKLPSTRTEVPPPPGEGGILPGPREGRILPGSARQEAEEPEVTHPKDPPALPAEAASPKKTKPPPAHLSTSSSTGQPMPKARPIFSGPQAPPPRAGEGGILPRAKSCEGRTLQYKEPPGPPPPQSAEAARSKTAAAKKTAQHTGQADTVPVDNRAPTLMVPTPKVPPKMQPEDVPSCRVRIVTCGLKCLRYAVQNATGQDAPFWIAKLCRHLHDLGVNHKALSQEDEEKLLEVLNFCDALGAGQNSILVLDMRGCTDPDHDRTLRGHLGTHPKTLLNISKHPHLKATLKHVRRFLWGKVTENSSRIFTIVSLCKSGNHRSVAAAKLLQMVTNAYARGEAAASQMPIDIEVKETEVIHMGELGRMWSQKCDNCQLCRHVRLDSAQRLMVQNALHQAMAAWRSA